jgi:ketosteroid isomerase-like protein
MATTVASHLTAEEHESIRRLTEDEWPAAALARDWDRLLALCSEDIRYMPADQPILHGHAALRAWFDQFPPIVKFTQPLEEVVGQGNMAMMHATFSVAIDVSGQRVENTGKALTWLSKGSSGRWLVNAVCWNWDRPLTPAA